MPIRMPTNAHLRTERRPLLPLPRAYRPGASFAYRVTDLDTREGWAGVPENKQFNLVASKNLFMFLQAHMIDSTRKEYSEKPEAWSAKRWEDYYRLCAGILQRKLKLT